jgi:hypothetical protein
MKILPKVFEKFDADKRMTKLKESQIGWEKRKTVTSPPLPRISVINT